MENELIAHEGSLLLFRTEDGRVDVDVIFDQDTVWLTQDQMAKLFGKSKSTISEHISNIFLEKELIPETCTHKFGNSEFMQKAPLYYNLDVIISVGYRVKSIVGTQFRQWATKRINEYIRKGFTMDDQRLKELGGGGYWKELIERIRDIRASEKVFYVKSLTFMQPALTTTQKPTLPFSFSRPCRTRFILRFMGKPQLR